MEGSHGGPGAPGPGQPGIGGYQQQPPQPPQPGYGDPQGYGGQGYGGQGYGGQGYDQPSPGAGERAAQVAHRIDRHIRTPETKPFYKASEFMVWLLVTIGLLIAGAVVDNGDHGDVLRANTVWILITILSFAYIISRGISKAGTKYNGGNSGGY